MDRVVQPLLAGAERCPHDTPPCSDADLQPCRRDESNPARVGSVEFDAAAAAKTYKIPGGGGTNMWAAGTGIHSSGSDSNVPPSTACESAPSQRSSNVA
jgi:hypothetical protein